MVRTAPGAARTKGRISNNNPYSWQARPTVSRDLSLLLAPFEINSSPLPSFFFPFLKAKVKAFARTLVFFLSRFCLTADATSSVCCPLVLSSSPLVLSWNTLMSPQYPSRCWVCTPNWWMNSWSFTSSLASFFLSLCFLLFNHSKMHYWVPSDVNPPGFQKSAWSSPSLLAIKLDFVVGLALCLVFQSFCCLSFLTCWRSACCSISISWAFWFKRNFLRWSTAWQALEVSPPWSLLRDKLACLCLLPLAITQWPLCDSSGKFLQLPMM